MQVTPIHNPDQSPNCLHGLIVRAKDWARTDLARFQGFTSWPMFVTWIRSVPHMDDMGGLICGLECCPLQRERHWSATANCWERAKYGLAAASVLLPKETALTLFDRETPAGRHISIIEVDLDHNSRKPYIHSNIKGMNPEPHIVINSVANVDENEARLYGAAAMDIGGGILGAVGGIFGGPTAGQAISGGIKSLNDNLVRPKGMIVPTATGINPSAFTNPDGSINIPISLQHKVGIDWQTIGIGVGGLLVGTVLVKTLVK